MPDRKRLRALIEENCLLADVNITLSTGAQSGFYFDCKRTMLDGKGLTLIADAFLEEINQLPERPSAIGGLTLGADFIVAAVIARAYQTGHPTVHGSIVRKEPKKHGTRNMLENPLPAGTPIVVIDDVITSGASIRKACEEFRQANYRIVGIIALIDRKAGGKESLERDFGLVRALFDKDDFPALRDTDHADRPSAQAA